MSCNLTQAKFDLAHCLAPIFYSYPKGAKKNLKLDVIYPYNKTTTLRFVCFEPLAVPELRLLQGLVALAGKDGSILKDKSPSLLGQQLRTLLALQQAAETDRLLFVKGTLNALIKEVGYTDGNAVRKEAKESLRRLANVTVFVTYGEKEASFHLLSYAFDANDGALAVALNPRLTEAILGTNPFAHIDLHDVRSLSSDPARLLHHRFCGWLRHEEANCVSLDVLCSYVWNSEAKPEAMKKRRQIIRKALAELASLRWEISEYSKAKFRICRPRLITELDRSIVPLAP